MREPLSVWGIDRTTTHRVRNVIWRSLANKPFVTTEILGDWTSRRRSSFRRKFFPLRHERIDNFMTLSKRASRHHLRPKEYPDITCERSPLAVKRTDGIWTPSRTWRSSMHILFEHIHDILETTAERASVNQIDYHFASETWTTSSGSMVPIRERAFVTRCQWHIGARNSIDTRNTFLKILRTASLSDARARDVRVLVAGHAQARRGHMTPPHTQTGHSVHASDWPAGTSQSSDGIKNDGLRTQLSGSQLVTAGWLHALAGWPPRSRVGRRRAHKATTMTRSATHDRSTGNRAELDDVNKADPLAATRNPLRQVLTIWRVSGELRRLQWLTTETFDVSILRSSSTSSFLWFRREVQDEQCITRSM